MKISRHIKAVACLVLWSDIVCAGLVHPHLRLRADTTALATATNTDANTDTAKATATATQTATKATKTEATTKASTASDSAEEQSQSQAQSTAHADASSTSGSKVPTSILTSITAATTTSTLNTTLFNSTIPAGQLPLTPVITPAWGVGGIILLLTGVTFALIGVRKRWLQTFVATAYLGALGTTVLIIYVMSPPISNGVQGGYLVAVVATGLVLGALAIVFKEIAEGLGCLLGGFCLAMWLMCVRPGGLIQSSGGTIGFIVGFTVCGYAFYFSHFTRHYALLVCIAFSGATAAVLGIDCFSRAGLKEFWAYVWSLNDDLFPLGTVTYPITRGIKVELAAVILIACAGVVSQLKLWRLVEEHRAKRDADRIEDEQRIAKEEEDVGRQIEAANARDREAWEAIHGDGTYVSGAVPPGAAGSMTSGEDSQSGDSGCDIDSNKGEKKVASSDVDVDNVQSNGVTVTVMEQDAKDGAVMVRVAEDEYPQGGPPYELPASGDASPDPSAQVTAPPVVVPLPFTVPANDDENADDKEDGDNDDDKKSDRSSVATFAAEDEVVPSATARRHESANSLAKRLSQGSVDLLRSISQRSKRAGGAAGNNLNSESQDKLVSRHTSGMMIRQVQDDDDDDNSSLAVTMDGMSSNGDIEEAEEAEKAVEAAETAPAETEEAAETAETVGTAEKTETEAQPTSDADASSPEVPKEEKRLSESTLPAATPAADEEASERRLSQDKSAVSAVSATPASLTKDRLPRSLSRVALSYRTNEWAKHLSNAEAPEVEAIPLGDLPVLPTKAPAAAAAAASSIDEDEHIIQETPAQVNVAELQQTAETGAPAPAAPRSASIYGALARSSSQQSVGQVAPTAPYNPLKVDPAASSNAINSLPSRNSLVGAPGAGSSTNSIANGWRSMSANLVHEPIAEEDTVGAAGAVGAVGAAGATDETTAESASPSQPQSRRGSQVPIPGVQSFSSPQTLIGQREMLLRNKSQQGTYIGGSLVRSVSAQSIQGLPGSGLQGLRNSYSMAQLAPISAGVSEAGSEHTGPSSTPTSGDAGVDLDDLPMSQRKAMLRQNSQMSLTGPASPTGAIPATAVPFDSHQPKRNVSHLPTAAARQAQLATFRNSVASDLRGSMLMAPAPATGTGGRLRDSMSTPYMPQTLGQGPSPLLNRYSSMSSLQNIEAPVQSSVDVQRQFLIAQKEAEAQRREMERQEKERASQAFEERMRRGDLLDAHRDAMRKMQASINRETMKSDF